MKGTIRLAQFKGIPILIHWSFGLMILFIAYTVYSNGMMGLQVIWFSLYVLMIFICVVMHEYGHALTAKRYGIKTKDIIISPIGGVARLMNMPSRPWHEFVIAIAGPLVNVFLAIILFLVIYFLLRIPPFDITDDTIGFNSFNDFIKNLLYINIILFVFNLIPAFPMDGGRVLRALLSFKFSRRLATQIATSIGKIIAVAFIGLGLYYGHMILPFIGVFIYSMANAENKQVQNAEKYHTPLAQLTKTSFTKLTPEITFNQIQEISKRTGEKNFLVFKNGQAIGSLPEPFLEEAFKKFDLAQPMGQYYSEQYAQLPSSATITDAISVIQSQGVSILGVIQNDQLIGVIDKETIKNHFGIK